MKESLSEYLEEGHRISRRSVVWLGDHVIIRTGRERVEELRPSLDGRVCIGGVLRTVAVSGAIGKLKRIAGAGKGAKLGEVS